jgi:hypothetical protein
MADNFGKEILFIFAFLAFIGLMYGMVSADFNGAGWDYTPKAGQDFNDPWLSAGNDLMTLEQTIPIEIFILIIVPIIVLALYIVMKTVSGVLPNWLSGG